MTKTTTGSFSQFDPVEVIERIDIHLLRIEVIKKETKDKWLFSKMQTGKTTGFLFWKKNRPWTEDELERYWEKGPESDSWSFETPKYCYWNHWDVTKAKFEKLRAFCQLATEAGNRTVNLSKEDALFAYNWS